MHVIYSRNVNDALYGALEKLKEYGYERDSRNGKVLMFEGPVTTLYDMPRERVLFDENRDANPYFHFMESLWMIAGRNDVKWISQFNSNIKNYSDDGKTFHGAYGYRWRKHFNTGVQHDSQVPWPIDQVDIVVNRLKEDPTDRRSLIQMWDAPVDLGKSGKDFPCNIAIMFARNVQNGKLDMTVVNRSNDIIWGCYGANVVHMSMLQEYMAGRIGVEVGNYWQISNNLHYYQNVKEAYEHIQRPDNWINPYLNGVRPFPMMNTTPEIWERDLHLFMEHGAVPGLEDKFFTRVAVPMLVSYKAYKDKNDPDRFVAARSALENCAAPDWKKACSEWLDRREK
jgi:thymidylate synthase